MASIPNGGSGGSIGASEAAVAAAADVAQVLRVDWNAGLSSDEADRRRQLYGMNEFNMKEEDPLWKKYLNQVRFTSCDLNT